MSITNELREWASVEVPYKYGHQLTAIADRIDAEHEAKVSYWQGASYKDGYDEGFASADDWLGQHEDAMAEHGWIRLPLDADGVPIHVGDVVEYADNPTELFTASYIELEKNGWWVFGGVMGRRPDNYRHHHEPTVEDVLRELLDEAEHFHSLEEERDAISEYAKRLTLAGDAE